MATFSTNQVRHLYVAKERLENKAALVAKKGEGLIAIEALSADTIRFYYKGADADGLGNNLVASDLIEKDKIIKVTKTEASKMCRHLKKYSLTLDSNINGGKPVIGQDYILRIAFRQFPGMSDEDQYFKYGVAHAYSDNASDVYKTLAVSLAKNFSREPYPLIDIKLKTSSGTTTVNALTTVDSLADTYTGIVISEFYPQPWRLGVLAETPVYFTLQPTTIVVNGDEVIWGTVKDVTEETPIETSNGRMTADLEYFCMGERGDIYRGINFPHNIVTKYLVDPTSNYDYLDIHYYYSGANEKVQKSEKVITIVVPTTQSSVMSGLVDFFKGKNIPVNGSTI